MHLFQGAAVDACSLLKFSSLKTQVVSLKEKIVCDKKNCVDHCCGVSQQICTDYKASCQVVDFVYSYWSHLVSSGLFDFFNSRQ
jgi:hypothetical protein